ncbi:hypothetical protein OG218_03730 [Kineococcus sp. NBC_00420]|uniref:hypothetical protein n=1 Tax=Kineococcus sp. NBC_00420 TaxID=2903564 RepID=UPI002E1C64D9
MLGLTAGKPVSEDGAALVVARILGARHLLQAAGGALVPGRTERRLAAAVDGVHAIACLALAVRAPRYARGALVDAILATTWCVLSLRTVRTHSSS